MEPNRNQVAIPRVLLVEDDICQSRTLTAVLQAEGFEVTACKTAAAGLTQLANDAIDAAVIDIGLPDIEEAELLEVLGEQADQVPIVIHTGCSFVR